MNYASIKRMDVANGPGVRMSLFVSGCTHYCKNCFNQEAWDFEYGEPFTEKEIEKIVDYVSGDYIAGLTLLGGEPLEPANQKGLLPLLRRMREVCPKKSVWCYTGYDFEKDILGRMMNEIEEMREFLSYIDVLVDGEYIEELHKFSLRFKGSSNQRIIMVQESLREKEVVLWDGVRQK
ncbi:MAG: anaerobic ribonucleoside-triphosphate reductase activating protein [Lachnospiraceae bacterium]|jgi:anaerobic ribonucleoside-triphosphate reductase activating protein|nr:anaerobic ribonucleoside-triphosphate reductase activating protein [Lachnospiraceae bacterium]MCI8824930.1 anaerobic ribonucleoside-triphosphate reductase activating protein [Lachnospiraceae bacterium]